MNRNFKLAVAIAAFVSGVNLAPAADKIPDATLDLSGGTVAAGVGYTWGRGTLHYRGRDYPFSVNGLTLINVGAEKMEATAEVYNLSKLAAGLVIDVMRTHPMVVIGGVLQENPFYMPPEELLRVFRDRDV